MPVQVFRPPGSGADAGPLPILYLLHGRGGDEASWFGGRIGEAGVGIDALAADLIAQGRIPPVIIASARIDDSYGVDSSPSDDGYSHGPYERYIVDELVVVVEARESVLREPAGRFIGGYSMGGFAALHAAFRHPMLFGGVAALSPAISLDVPATREWLYPDEATRIAHDPLRLALTAPIDALPIFLGRGESDYDWIVDATDALAAELAGRGVDVSTVIVPGGHEVGTWRALAPAMLTALLGAG